jgi:sugar phosphate isomerase/epimerase
VPRTENEDRRVLLEALEELGKHADEQRTLVLLEPLNRYEDHMLNRVEQAVELCEAIGRPSVKVMGDLFHMNIEEDDLGEAIRQAGSHIAHVHLADSNRHLPGHGHTDFVAPLRALAKGGFSGWFALECMVAGDPNESIPACVRYLRDA